MKLRRTIALGLSTILLMGTLVGCGKGNSNSSDASKDNNTGSEVTTEKKEIVFPYTGEEVVFKGYSMDGPVEDPNLACTEEWYKRRGNVRIDWEKAPYTDYLEKIKVLISSNDIPDVIYVQEPAKYVSMYGGSGMFLDFNKYIDYMPNLKKYRESYPNLDYLVNEKNERFAITGINPIDSFGESWFANKTLLDKHNIAVPETFDQLMEAMRAIKKADPSVIPFQSYWNINYTMAWIARSIDAQTDLIYFNAETDKFESVYTEPTAKRKEIIQIMATMYKEGLINPEIATLSFEQEQNVIASNNWAFTAMYLGSIENEIYKTKGESDLPIDIQPILPPKTPEGKSYVSLAYQHDAVPVWGTIANAKVKNPELLAAYLDLVNSKETGDLCHYGIEGVTYERDAQGKITLKDVNRADYGVSAQYDMWLHTFAPTQRIQHTPLAKEAADMQLNALISGACDPWYSKATPLFAQDAGEEKGRLFNVLQTYVTENETKFIYGQRPMSEWDAYVEEVRKVTDLEKLLNLYNDSKIIKQTGERVYTYQGE